MQELVTGLRTAFINSEINSNLAYRPEFISNDYKNGKKVSVSIEQELRRCEEFYISVAFITEGGLAPLKQVLAELREKGISGKILTTNYLSFTEPKALKTLAAMPNIELKIYDSDDTGAYGFHTKGYIFKKDELYRFIIGSSNMTSSAFAVNKEWNTKLVSTSEGEVLKQMMAEFQELWNDKHTYNFDDFIGNYEIKYKIVKEQKRIAAASSIIDLQSYKLSSNSMQVKFIENFQKLMDSGEHRGLLISSCGSGKSLASAFALRETNQKKVLFLVHREQIAKQALKSYQKVFGKKRSYGLMSGTSKSFDADYIFSTMQTMAKDEILKSFKPDHFDTIVVDEVHRAGAKSYQKIMAYFTPKFYLGMTASPERTDGFDIYELFDHNVAYEIRLQQALAQDLLCPFHYYGITDIQVGGEAIDESEDFNNLIRADRVDHILEQANYYGYNGDRVKGLIFVSRKEEGRELSKLFNERGYRTEFLSGEDSQAKRENAIERLEQDEYENGLDYIFSVDIMNEGIDAPKVNQVIMLRPTESPIVFVQQLGRGLRKSDGKEYVVILDFIGNYRNNYMIPIALSGDRTYNKDNIRKYVISGNSIIPGESTIHFDEIARERIFKSIDTIRGIRSIMKDSYMVLKNKLGRVPYLLDFYENGEIDPLVIIKEYKTYAAFIQNVEKDKVTGILSDHEKLILEYLSKTILSGIRPYELEILRELMNKEHFSCSEICQNIEKKYGISVVQKDMTSALSVLKGEFVAKNSEYQKYCHIDIINVDKGQQITRLSKYAELLLHAEFYRQMNDLIDVGLRVYQEKYNSKDRFVLYEKYSRRDVSLLMNCERDLSSVMYGMKRLEDDVFIFVTYHKAETQDETKEYLEGKPDYADFFEDNLVFRWDAQVGRGINSSYAKDVIDAKRKHLLVKKSDAEINFYYMGQFDIIDVQAAKKKDNSGKERDLTKFKVKMHTPVREDLLQYLQSKIDA